MSHSMSHKKEAVFGNGNESKVIAKYSMGWSQVKCCCPPSGSRKEIDQG